MTNSISAIVSSLAETYSDQLLISILVFTRLSGLAMAAPIVGSRSVPVRIRALLVLALTLLIAPLHWQASLDGPDSLLELLLAVALEVLVGLVLGVGVTIVLMGLQLAGHIASYMSGMALADIFDPGIDTSIPIFAQLLDVLALLVFVIIGGHRLVIDALLDTFRWMPPGTATISPHAVAVLQEVVTQSFVLGIRAAAPVIVSLLLSVLVLGLIGRTLPQLNILAVGLSLNSVMMLATLAISLGSIVWIFLDELDPTVTMIWDMFRAR